MNHFQVDFMADEVTNVVDAVLDHGRPKSNSNCKRDQR